MKYHITLGHMLGIYRVSHTSVFIRMNKLRPLELTPWTWWCIYVSLKLLFRGVVPEAKYQEQGQVITSHRYCGILPLIPASGTILHCWSRYWILFLRRQAPTSIGDFFYHWKYYVVKNIMIYYLQNFMLLLAKSPFPLISSPVLPPFGVGAWRKACL